MRKRFYIPGIILSLFLVVGVWWLLAKESIISNVQLVRFYTSQGGDGEKFWILRSALSSENPCTDEEVTAIQKVYETKKFSKKACSSLMNGYIVARPHPYKTINFITPEKRGPDDKPFQEDGFWDEMVLFKKTSNGQYQIVYFATRSLI